MRLKLLSHPKNLSTTSNFPIVSVEKDMWSTLFRFGIPPFFYLGPNTPVVKDMSVREMYGTSYQPRYVLVCFWVPPFLFFICMSFRSGMSFLLSCSFPGPRSIAIGKHCDVTATCILLPFVFL